MHAAAVECMTGWYWVKDAFAGEIDLHLAHAKGVKVEANSLAADLLPEAHMISDEMRPLRDVLRTRLRLVERRVGAQNSIARLLEKHNVQDVADLDAFGRLQAECHIEQAESLHGQIKRLEKALHPHLVPDADVQRLLRIPGIGKACAFTIRLEVDDIDRFPTERQFFSYCRVVPGADNSGERVRHKRSRDGNRYLKDGLLARGRAIDPVLPRDPVMVRIQEASQARCRRASTRRQGDRTDRIRSIVYHVLRKQEDFNGQFKGTPLSRVKKEQWPLLPSPASITGDGEDPDPRLPSAGMGGE